VDIYNTQFRVGVEVDGEQHTQGWLSLSEVPDFLRRDQNKDRYFKVNPCLGPLLRFSAKDLRNKTIYEIQQHFSLVMEQHAIPRNTTASFVYKGLPTKEESRRTWLSDLANSKDCVLLETEYYNNTTKHKFSCSKHGVFFATPNHMRDSAYGCVRCAKEAAGDKLRSKAGSLPFEEARILARSLNIPTYSEYVRQAQCIELPVGLPSNPYVVYKKHPLWKGIKDFLGN